MAYYNPYYDFAKTNAAPPEGLPAPQAQSTPDTSTPTGRDWSGAIVAGVGQIGPALQQGSGPTGDFSVDPWAGYSGSAQGFASGGPVGAIIGGVSGQIGTFSKVHNNLKGLNTGVSVTDTDPITGKPIYRGQNALTAQQNISALNKGQRSISRSLDPATQVTSALLGTKDTIKFKRRQMERNLHSANEDYNNKTIQYNQQQSAMAQYNDMLNNQSRLRNLYSIGTSLY